MATYRQADRRAGSMPGQFGEEAAHFQQALRPRPHQAEGSKCLGIELVRQGNLGELVASFHEAPRLYPDLVDVTLNLGHALRARDRLDEAGASSLQALDRRRDPPVRAGRGLRSAVHRPGALGLSQQRSACRPRAPDQ
jgi:Flp pilus assembly protein TadD